MLLNPLTYKKDYKPRPSEIYPGNIRMVQHKKSNVIYGINIIKGKNHDYLKRYRKVIWQKSNILS